MQYVGFFMTKKKKQCMNISFSDLLFIIFSNFAPHIHTISASPLLSDQQGELDVFWDIVKENRLRTWRLETLHFATCEQS